MVQRCRRKRSPGYAFPPQTIKHPAMAKDSEEASSSRLSEQLSNNTLSRSQFPHFNAQFGAESSPEPQLDLQRKLIQHQIEFLQNQLQLLKPSDEEQTRNVGTFKGKSVSSPSSSVIDSGEDLKGT